MRYNESLFSWEMVKGGEVGKAYQKVMRWMAAGAVDEVVSKMKFKKAPQKMLDIGGSHGLYCVAFCRKYPQLQATNLDWRIGLENAELTLKEEAEMAERISLHEADFVRENLPGGFDFFLLGNIIHGLSAEENKVLFSKIFESAVSGAQVAITDQFANIKGSSFSKGVASLIGWNLFLFNGGRSYAYEQVKLWLEEAGFSGVRIQNLKRTPGSSMIVAEKN